MSRRGAGFGSMFGKLPNTNIGDDAADAAGASRYADKINPQNINIKVDAQLPPRTNSKTRKAAKTAATLAVAAGLGGLYFYLKDEENDENRKRCKRKCVPVNWDDFIGYEDSLWKSCKDLSEEDRGAKRCKPNSQIEDEEQVGHQLGEDYCKETYGDNWEDNCNYYKMENITRGELIWQPGPGREVDPNQPYCTPELDNPLEQTCPEFCEEECNAKYPKTNPFDPSQWWKALQDTWPFNQFPDLPWSTIILIIMAVILLPIILSLVK